MNYWIEQDDYWVMCFRGVEIPIMAKAPKQDGVEDTDGTWVMEWWEPLEATLVGDTGQEDMSVFYSWVAECLTESGRIPVVICRIDVETGKELEIWGLRDTRIEDFECDEAYTITFTLNFDIANQYIKGD